MRTVQVEISDRAHLRQVLESHKVPVNTWAEKTFEELYHQVSTHEVLLHEVGRRLMRDTHRAQMLAFRKIPGTSKYEFLKEEAQVFTDHRKGKRRRRRREISFSEKRHRFSETFLQAVIRGGFEELLVPDEPEFRVRLVPRQIVLLKELRTRPRLSKTYPGLLTRSVIERFGCIFTEEQYRPRYEEHDKGKITACSWVPWKGKLPPKLRNMRI